jgi:hypothetical protein
VDQIKEKISQRGINADIDQIEAVLMASSDLLDEAQEKETLDRAFMVWQENDEAAIRNQLLEQGPYLRASSDPQDVIQYGALLKAFRAHSTERDLGEKHILDRQAEIMQSTPAENLEKALAPYRELGQLRQMSMMQRMGSVEITKHLADNPDHPYKGLWEDELNRQQTGYSFRYDAACQTMGQEYDVDPELVKVCVLSEAQARGYNPGWTRPSMQPVHEAREVSADAEVERPSLGL